MADPSELLTLTERYRRAVLAREQEALRPMIRAYGAAYTRLQTQLEALLLVMKDMPQPIKLATLNREVRYRELMVQIEEELRRFGPLADEMLQQLVEDSAALGLEAGAATLRAAGVRGSFNLLPARAMETLAGFLQPETPLSAYLVSDQMLPGMLQQVTDALMMGMARGQNPRVIGSAMRQAFGKGLTSAVRTARTVNLWAYREANRAQWQENADVVQGWVWHAHLGKRTCASCINMHGTIHPLSEPLNDHWNGRCAMVCITSDTEEWARGMKHSGQRWFGTLDAKTQQEHFGDPNVYKAWKTGKIRWDDLTREKPDQAFGQMRQMPSAKELGLSQPKHKAA